MHVRDDVGEARCQRRRRPVRRWRALEHGEVTAPVLHLHRKARHYHGDELHVDGQVDEMYAVPEGAPHRDHFGGRPRREIHRDDVARACLTGRPPDDHVLARNAPAVDEHQRAGYPLLEPAVGHRYEKRFGAAVGIKVDVSHGVAVEERFHPVEELPRQEFAEAPRAVAYCERGQRVQGSRRDYSIEDVQPGVVDQSGPRVRMFSGLDSTPMPGVEGQTGSAKKVESEAQDD